MSCNNTYKTLCAYNDNRVLTPISDIPCKGYAPYNNYNTLMYCCDSKKNYSTKGKVSFTYTPESDSCWQNKRCY